MSRPRWLTPNDTGGGTICRPLSVRFELIPMVSGAILELTNAENWEADGDMTPDDCADYCLTAYEEYKEGTCSMVPTGSIMLWPGADIPAGWMLCNGESLAVAEYPALYAIIGYVFGGSGENFNLPDMRNYFSVGAGDNYSIADTGGEDAHVLTENEMPSHRHTLPNYAHWHLSLMPSNPVGPSWSIPDIQYSDPNTGYTGGDASHENRPPYVALSYIIRTS